MNEKENASDKIELKWYEKKQGITLEQKVKRIEGKEARKRRREEEKSDNKRTAGKKSQKNAHRTKSSDENFHSTAGHRVNFCQADKTEALFDLSALDAAGRKVINDFEKIVSSIYPLTSKQRALLPGQIRSLSHELTDEREDRRLGYMNETTALSAYIHYYLWWNIVRLTRLFANLPDDFFNIGDGSICLDIGSGPLTVPIAIFLSRPELRNKKITWYCMDISSQALTAGENIFLSVSAALECEPWKILRVTGQLGTPVKEKVDFLTSANVFNEIMQNADMPPDYLAKKYALELLSYMNKNNEDTRMFIVEPGVPNCGRFISLLRAALQKRQFFPSAPCTHCSECPMDGKRGGKWCNFSFSTEDAPQALRSFSKSIYIPKERAVLSFIAAKRNVQAAEDVQKIAETEILEKSEQKETLQESDFEKEATLHKGKLSFRITSDPISLPGKRTGYYACSKQGLLLIVTDDNMHSGEAYSTYVPRDMSHIDSKSGALVLNIKVNHKFDKKNHNRD